MPGEIINSFVETGYTYEVIAYLEYIDRQDKFIEL